MENIIYEGYNDKITDLKLFKAKNVSGEKHFHRCFEMIYVLSGTMNCTVNGKDIVATEDDIVFVQKYYSHRYKSVKDYEKFVFLIPSDVYGDFEKKLSLKTLPSHMSDKDFNKTLRAMIENLHENLANKSGLIKKGYINVFLGELIAHYPLEPISKNDNIDLLVSILDYIDENYEKPITLDSISSAFGYNKYYFSKLFNHHIGENLNTYINIVRLQQMMARAKKAEKVNITELAYECGFDSLATFYRYFGKIYGNSPKEALRGVGSKRQ